MPVGEDEGLAGLDLAAGADERGPLVRGELLGEQDFDAAGGCGRARLRVQAEAMGEEPRGKDAGVVEDEEVAVAQMRGEIGEEVIFNRAGRAVDSQHAAGATDLRRSLGDEFFGEIEVEVGDAHLISLETTASAP